MVSEWQEKIKYLFEDNKSDLFVAATVFLVGLGGFGLGRLSVLIPEKKPIIIENQEAKQLTFGSGARLRAGASSGLPLNGKGKYVASKSGSAFHYPWCPGAIKIKEENKIWFQTKEEAISKGYKPAGNCEGL